MTRVVAITGATSGIGRGIALDLAGRGISVVGCGRRADRGAELVEAARGLAGRIDFVEADVTDADRCRAFVDAVLDRHGRIDGLVNNAGGHVEGGVGPSAQVTPQAWDATMALNVRGAFFCATAAIAAMAAQDDGGAVLNVSSVQAVLSVADMTAYNAAKAALTQMSRSLAVENMSTGVRVNSVLLGGVDVPGSPRLRRWLVEGRGGVGTPPAPRPAELRGIPLADVAAAFALLLSPDARAITGATIAMDRGLGAGSALSALVHSAAAAGYEPEGRESHD